MKDSPRAGTVRNELRTCPWPGVTIASVPRRLRATQVEEVIAIPEEKEGTADWLGDWTVPGQFRFTFRVELRMSVNDRHQGRRGPLSDPRRSMQFRVYCSAAGIRPIFETVECFQLEDR